jgi:hypothetical protein
MPDVLYDCIFVSSSRVEMYTDFETTKMSHSGFGSLGVACWPLVPKFVGSNPVEAIRFFRGKKILSRPSFRREVKLSVPCCRFVACKRSLQMAWNSPFVSKITGHFLPPVPPFPARGLLCHRRRGDTWWHKWELQKLG